MTTREKNRIYQKTYREKHRDFITKYNKEYYKKTHKKRRLSSKKSSDKIRLIMFDLLGHECKRCGFSDKRALQIDHINGGGNKEAKLFKSGTTMIRRYRDNPELAKQKLQILCANCNWIKRYENKEVQEKCIIYK